MFLASGDGFSGRLISSTSPSPPTSSRTSPGRTWSAPPSTWRTWRSTRIARSACSAALT
jgi:hypothetical protein